jgi:RNA polymerase sigma factor (TIGR02999 family)
MSLPPNPAEPLATAAKMDSLFDELYERLKSLAGRQRSRHSSSATLETTALVHELYLRMSNNRELVFEHEGQFFSYAARAMRHLLVDRARNRLRQRGGGDWVRITLTGSDEQIAIESAEHALALDATLLRLKKTDARAAQVLELRYFAGLTTEQIATTLHLASCTIDRDWRFARAFLRNEISR